MRYHIEKPRIYTTSYGQTISCTHPVYSRCTILRIGKKGIGIIQQRYDDITKKTWWSEIDEWLPDKIYTNKNFRSYFDKYAGEPIDGLYPTVTVRQIMWSLKMKPLKKEVWETTFDRKFI